MKNLIDFYNSNQKIIIALILLVIFILSIHVIKKLIYRRQRKKELEQASADRLRDENLNHVILNQGTGKSGIKEVYKPYDVDYSKPNSENINMEKRYGHGESHIMLQLVEKTELSTRKFMMNPVRPIRIGSDSEDNDITVLAKDVLPHQCEIFSVGNKVYIKNKESGNQTILKRKKERAIVSGTGVRLHSGDTVILGSVSYDVTIIDKRLITRGMGR